MVARVADEPKKGNLEPQLNQVSQTLKDAIKQAQNIRDQNTDPPLTPRAATVERQEKIALAQKIRQEFEEPAIVIIGHALLIVFGILVLSFLGWLVDHAHISDVAKEILHVIDEYLMIFAFVILGFSFIIKIGTVLLGGVRK